MSTIAETIKSRLTVDGEKVLPDRTEEETKKICDNESLLEKEFIGAAKQVDYTAVKLTDLAGEGERSESNPEEALDPGLIGHTDAIRVGGETFSVVVAKTATEVLNCLQEGLYMAVSFEINILKLDSGSLETGTRDFRPRAANLPRARKSTRLEDNLVVIEPSLNGFKISVFVEELDDNSYAALMKLNDWIEDYQGALLEKVLLELKDMGVPEEALLRSQSSLGVIPKARRLFESKVAREGLEEDETPVITQDIRKQSGQFANTLNDALNLEPLTNTTIEFGLQAYTVQVTKRAEIIKEWKSSRSNLSYFQKGEVSGRITRLVGSKRKIPVTQVSLPKVMNKLEELVPNVLTTFENIARSQLDLPLVAVAQLPESIKCEKRNINELFGVDPSVTYGYQMEYLAQAKEEIEKKIKSQEGKSIISLMEKFTRDTSDTASSSSSSDNN